VPLNSRQPDTPQTRHATADKHPVDRWKYDVLQNPVTESYKHSSTESEDQRLKLYLLVHFIHSADSTYYRDHHEYDGNDRL